MRKAVHDIYVYSQSKSICIMNEQENIEMIKNQIELINAQNENCLKKSLLIEMN